MFSTQTSQRVPGKFQTADDFAIAVMDGLTRPRKTLPCRFLYDAKGSDLFEDITRLPEYYPSRTEAEILSANASKLAENVPDGGVLVEFGSGSSLKTEILLNELPTLHAYVPVDVSRSALEAAKQRLRVRFPDLDVRPVVADFSEAIPFPRDLSKRPKTGFFPGSTIGNLTPPEAARLLCKWRGTLGPAARLIIGVDLKKETRKLVLAYNDASGVTADFNLNLLVRINRELGPAFDVDSFRHEAIYDPGKGRIEMHLVSLKDQTVWLLGQPIRFGAGESIHTENSYKYSIADFVQLSRSAGWTPCNVWTDNNCLFSVHELSAA